MELSVINTFATTTFSPCDFRKRIASIVFFKDPGSLVIRVVNLRPVRINANLYLLHPQLPHLGRLPFTNHGCVGLDFDVEQKTPRIGHQFQKILPHENFSPLNVRKKVPA